MSWKIPKTVLGNEIEWDTSKIPGRRKRGTWSGKDDQLWRCRKTKKFEASLLDNLPRGACFVDAGAHFGDTVVTLALYARDTLRRTDIRFVAFEPNPAKARFIEECAAANGLGPRGDNAIEVVSCVLGDETSVRGARARREREKDWCQFDGRTSYEGVVDEVPRDSVQAVDREQCKTTNGDDSCSSSSESSSSSCDNLLDVHKLDDYFEAIHPVGFLHIDVEGWEAKVLRGASKLLTSVSSRCYILAETFNPREARRRGPGFSQTHEEDILEVMSNFPSFSRGEDVIDGERNLFFVREEG